MATKQVSVSLRLTGQELIDLVRDKFLINEAFIPDTISFDERSKEFVFTGSEVAMKSMAKIDTPSETIPSGLIHRNVPSYRSVLEEVLTSKEEVTYDEIVKHVQSRGKATDISSFGQAMSRHARRLRPGVFTLKKD